MAANSINLSTAELPEILDFIETASREELEAVSKNPETPMTKNEKGRTEIITYKYISVANMIDSFRKYCLGAIYIETDKNGGSKPWIAKTASFNKAVYHDGKYYNLLQMMKIQTGGTVQPYNKRLEAQRKVDLKDNELNHQPSIMFTNVLPKEDENGNIIPFDDDIARSNEFVYALLIHEALVSRKWENMVEDFKWECKNERDKAEVARAKAAQDEYGFNPKWGFKFNKSFKPYSKMVKNEETKKSEKTEIEGKYLLNLNLMKTENVLHEEFLDVTVKKIGRNGKITFAEMLVDGKRLTVHNCHEVFKYGLQFTGILNLGSVRVGGTGTSNKYSFGKLFNFKNPKAPVTIYLDPSTIKSRDEEDGDDAVGVFGDSDLVSELLANAKNVDEETAEVLEITADPATVDETHISNDDNISNILGGIADTV